MTTTNKGKMVEVKVLTKDDPGPLFGHINTDAITESDITHVGILQNGMESGRTSVCLCIPIKIKVDGPEDHHVLVQLSAAQFETLAGDVRGAAGRFGEDL